MNQIWEIVQSGTFWTAIGSIAAILGVLVALVQGRKRKKRVSRSERQRILEQAREAASRFDYWMKNFIHHDQGEKSDKQKLIAWLESDRGYAQVAEDY